MLRPGRGRRPGCAITAVRLPRPPVLRGGDGRGEGGRSPAAKGTRLREATSPPHPSPPSPLPPEYREERAGGGAREPPIESETFKKARFPRRFGIGCCCTSFPLMRMPN